MANEFVARNGLIAQDNSQITGSVRITGNTSIGTSYNGFPLNVQGTAYIIGGSVWVNDGYGLVNASSTNTGIYPDSTHNITIKNNNNTTVYIKSDGNVGIGTTSPSRILHVVSPDTSVLFQSTTGTNSVNLQLNNSGGNFYVGSDNSTGTSFGTGTAYSGVVFVYGLNRPLVFGTDSTERMRITSTGNVGIGTTSPTVKLHVSGTTSGLFEVDGLNAINALYVSASGNVGIGTGSPVNRLHVYNSVTGSGAERTTAVDVLTLETENTTAVEYDGFGQIINFRGVTYNDATKRNLGRIIHKIRDLSGGATHGTSLHFELLPNATASVPVERVVFDKNGNVGIGSSIPGATLDVAGDINFSGAVKYGGVNVIHNASTDVYINGRVIYSNSTYNDGMYIGYNSTGGTSAHIRFFANGTNERMRIDAASGNIGIATTSPTLAKLQVQGNIWAQSFTGSFSGSSAAPGSNTQVIFNSSGSLAASSGFVFDGTNVGIGTTSPQSQFHIFKSTNLGGTAGDYLILKTLQNPGGAGGNNVYERTWAYRTGTGTDWTTWSIWNGISIDASYGTPTISRTWYWRDPYAGKQHFGDATVNIMTIGPSNVGIGTTSPAYKLEVSSSIAFSSTGLFSLQRITPNGSSGRQIVITSAGVNAGNISTANNIVCIGPFAGQALTGSGADSLIAIGNNAAGSITTGGSYSIFIGRGASNGITTGNNNIIINSSDSGGVPSNTSNALHLITAGGFEGNDGARALGGETSQYAFIGGGNTHPQYTRRFYFGGGPFVTTPQNANIDFYAPSATGSSDQQGANFTINAGRGTGTGTPGDFIIATSSTGSSGVVNQTLSSRVWIKGNSGNVGIGSSTPAFKLDMPGIVQARLGNAEIGTTTFNSSYAFFGHETLDHSVANNYALLQDSLGGTYLNAAATKNIEFRISNTAVATILSGGNVGIGLTSPSAYLDVKGLADTAGVISLQLRSGNANSNFNSNQITLGYSNTAEYRHAIKTRHNSGASSGNSIDFYTWAYGGATTAIGGQHVMSLDGANVGIGTTSPGAKLDVIGNVRAQSFTGSFSGSSAAPGSNTQVIFNSSGSLAASSSFIFNGANVGIGTTTLSQRLSIGSADSDAIIINVGGKLYFRDTSTSIFEGSGLNLIAGSSRPMIFSADGSERMRIALGGNVGIGTSNPVYTLDVNAVANPGSMLRGTGDLRYFVFSTGTTQWVGYELRSSNVNSFAGGIFRNNADNNRVSLYNKNTEAISLMDTGNVGIGTASPSFKLDVSGSAKVHYLQIQDAGYAGGLPTTPEIYSPASATLAISAGGSERVRINNSGSVGIGTTAPAFKLDMPGTVQSRLGVAEVGAWPFNTSYAYFGHEALNHASVGNYALLQDSVGATYLNAASAQPIYFRINNSDVGVILSNGNVGIGTTAPNVKLQVAGTINSYAPSTDGIVLVSQAASSGGLTSVQIHSNGLTYFNGGNVGIGTTTPSAKLQVSGSSNTVNVKGSGSALFSVDGTAGRLFQVDDSLSGSLFSVNTAAGLPVIEAFSDNTVRIGQFGQRALFVSQSRVGIGLENPTAKLHVSGTTGGIFEVDGVNAVNALYVSASGNVGIGTTSPLGKLHVNPATTNEIAIAINGTQGYTNNNFQRISAGDQNSVNRLSIGFGYNNTPEWTIRYSSYHNHEFYTGNDWGSSTERMRITGGGNVGIGSTSPGATLDVNGNVRAQSFTGSFSGSSAAPGANTQVIFNSSGSLAASSNFVFNGTNLGLGVTPSAWGSGFRAIQVGLGSALYNNTNSNGTFLGSNFFWNGSSNVYISTATATAYAQTLGEHQWFTAGSGTAGTTVSFNQLMTLDSSGRLGIGTTAPGQKLDVVGRLRFRSDGVESPGAWLTGNGGTQDVFVGLQGVSSTDAFGVYSAAAWRFTILNGGNVGIGTTSPQTKLHIVAAGAPDGITLEPSSGTESPEIRFVTSTNHYNIDNSAGTLRFFTETGYGTGGVVRAVINSSGNVGIGSASPAYALDVNGTARVTTLIETSSKRYKKNIKKLSPSLPIISSLRPVTFNWKDKAKGEDTQYGLIAEEVLSIIPEAVSVNDKGEAEAISYTKLIPVLIKAVQELQTKVEKLEKQLSK